MRKAFLYMITIFWRRPARNSLDKLEKRAVSNLTNLNHEIALYEAKREELNQIAKKIDRESKKASQLLTQHKEEIAKVRSENTVHDTTIASLVFANKLLQETWEAQIANQVRLKSTNQISSQE